MRGRLLSLSLILALVSGCAVQTVSTPFIPEKSRLVGIWAMLPLRNGTAGGLVLEVVLPSGKHMLPGVPNASRYARTSD